MGMTEVETGVMMDLVPAERLSKWQEQFRPSIRVHGEMFVLFLRIPHLGMVARLSPVSEAMKGWLRHIERCLRSAVSLLFPLSPACFSELSKRFSPVYMCVRVCVFCVQYMCMSRSAVFAV